MSQSISGGGFAETERKTNNFRPLVTTRLNPYFLPFGGPDYGGVFSSPAAALAPFHTRFRVARLSGGD
jgi:hypothetical protein